MGKRDKDNLLRYTRVRGKKTDHKYLELFRAIDQQMVYNEAELRKRFGFSNFSEAKNHLASLILKVLRIYNAHPETEMQNRLTEIRLLMERSLHHFAMKKIRKARSIAVLEERFDALQELADFELRALPFVADAGELPGRRAGILAMRDEARKEQEVWRRLSDIHDKQINSVIGDAARSGQFTPERVMEIEELPELKTRDEELSARARSMKYRIWNVIRHHQLDFERRAAVLREVLQNYEQNPFLIEEEPVRYIFSLGGYGVCLNVVKRYGEALQATMKLLELRTDSDHLRRSVFLNFSSNLSIYTLNTGETDPFSEHTAFLLQGLREHRGHTPESTLTYIHYLFSINFWLADDMRRANRFAKRAISNPGGRPNLQAACRCFLLIFAYEQNDPELILQSIRNWGRQTRRKAHTYQVEQIFTAFMAELIDLPGWRDQDKAFARCREEVNDLLAEGFRVRKDNFIFLLHWMQARLERKALVEIVKAQRKV